MGQKRPVDVYLLVTEDTIEERMLNLLAGKQELALAALDSESDVTQVSLESGMEELKRRLEILLGSQATAPVDEAQRQRVVDVQDQTEERRRRVASAGGEMLGAVFGFLNELVRGDDLPTPSTEIVESVRGRLEECVATDEDGSQKLMLTLPNRDALQGLAQTLAQLLVAGSGQEEQAPAARPTRPR
jgi:hypothetical protein